MRNIVALRIYLVNIRRANYNCVNRGWDVHMRNQLLIDSLQPVDQRGLHERVLAQLLVAIRNGQLQPGEHLREAEIAERLGLSRGTVREAIRRLEQEGLVVSQPHRGAYIAQLAAGDAAEIYSLRRVLEVFAIELLVPRSSAEVVNGLEAIVREMVAVAESGNRIGHLQLDLRFHEQLCLLSRHRTLHHTWTGLALKLWLVNFQLPSHLDSDLVSRATAHFELVELIRAGQTAAAIFWIQQHVDNRSRRVFDAIGTPPTSGR